VVEPSAPSSTTQTTLVTTGSTAGGTLPGTVPSGTSGGAAPSPGRSARPTPAIKHSSSIWLEVALGLVIALLLGTAWVVLRRQRRQRDDGPADQRVVRSWELAQRTLRRRGVARRPAETPGEFAARLARLEGQGRALGAEALGQLAALVELACYTPWPCTTGQADAARSWADAVTRATRRRS
jgi:hypothetical protein